MVGCGTCGATLSEADAFRWYNLDGTLAYYECEDCRPVYDLDL